MSPHLCKCGCGQSTKIAKQTSGGYRKGEPFRFVLGHSTKGKLYSPERRMQLSQSLKGHPVSAETKAKISEHHKTAGIRPSNEAIAKSNLNRPTRNENPNWKGGTSMVNGYRCRYVPDHPRAHPNGYVYEHILTAEKMIGRALQAGEVVHHLDKDKTNNAPGNLQVLSSQSRHIVLHRHQGDII